MTGSIARQLAEEALHELDEAREKGLYKDGHDADMKRCEWIGRLGEALKLLLQDTEPAGARPGNGPLREGTVSGGCGAADGDYICTAAEGHTGPHMAYDGFASDENPQPKVCHSWPQDGAS